MILKIEKYDKKFAFADYLIITLKGVKDEKVKSTEKGRVMYHIIIYKDKCRPTVNNDTVCQIWMLDLHKMREFPLLNLKCVNILTMNLHRGLLFRA